MYNNSIAEIDENLYLGSRVSIQYINEFKIKNVFHIGFTPEFYEKNVNYFYIDLEDNSQSVNKMIDEGKKIIQKINTCFEKGEKVLICCVMGRSRSASMTVMWLHYKYPKMSYDDVVKKIKTKRTISINQTFVDFLREYFTKKNDEKN